MPAPDPNSRHFEILEVGYLRALDAEVKILEYLANRFDQQSQGTVYLFSERPICLSCQGVIRQFTEMFPNIAVRTGSGP